MEETLKLILNKLEKLEAGQVKLDAIEREVTSIKSELKQVNSRLDKLETGQLRLEAGQEELIIKVDRGFLSTNSCFNIAYDKIDELKNSEIKTRL